MLAKQGFLELRVVRSDQSEPIVEVFFILSGRHARFFLKNGVKGSLGIETTF